MQLHKLKKKKFRDENELQELVEENLEEIFSLDFLTSQFKTGQCRFDTLAYDTKRKSFVVIEYKNKEDDKSVGQVQHYRRAVLDNPFDCIEEYNDNHKGWPIKRKDVDWTALRILLVSPVFSQRQMSALLDPDTPPVELWKVKRFEDGSMSLNQLTHSSKGGKIGSLEPIFLRPRVPNNTEFERNTPEASVSPQEGKQHFDRPGSSLQSVWIKLRRDLSKFPNTDFNEKERYVSFRKQGKVVCYINFQQKRLKIAVNRGKQQPDGRRSKEFFTMSNDPKGICKENTWQWNDGTKGCEYVWFVSDTKDLNDTIQLIKQKYDHLGQIQNKAATNVSTSPEEESLVGKLDSSLQLVWIKLREKLSQFTNTDFNVRRSYISLCKKGKSKQGKPVCFIYFQKGGLKIIVHRGKQDPDGQRSKGFFTMRDDPKGIFEENTWDWKDGSKGLEYERFMSDTKDLDYTVRLIKQKYDHLGKIQKKAPLEASAPLGLDSVHQPHSRDARKGFNGFAELGIKEGAVLKFKGHPGITCVVAGDKQVSYQGESMSLSGAAHRACELLGRSSSVSGPREWMFNGKSIDNLRRNRQGQASSPGASISTKEKRHVDRLEPSLQPVWFKLREKLSKLADVRFDVKKEYIAFCKRGKVVCYAMFQQKGLRIKVIRGSQNPDGVKARKFFTVSDDRLKSLCTEDEINFRTGSKRPYYFWFVSGSNLNDTVRVIRQKYDQV